MKMSPSIEMSEQYFWKYYAILTFNKISSRNNSRLYRVNSDILGQVLNFHMEKSFLPLIITALEAFLKSSRC